ncbi:MAG: hypothetical protein ACXVOH_03505 [Bacteroidia bacterium]
MVKKGKMIPSSLNCKAGGMHSWNYLGKTGAVKYTCKKCNLVLKSKFMPLLPDCPKGKNHSWEASDAILL